MQSKPTTKDTLLSKLKTKLVTNSVQGKAALQNKADQYKQQLQKLTRQIKTQQIQLKNHQYRIYKKDQELKKAQFKYKNLYDLAPVGYFNLSSKGIIQNTNKKAEEMLGWNKDQLIGKPLSSFVHHNSLATYFNYLSNPDTFRTYTTCELKFVRKHGIPFDAQMDVSSQVNQGQITEVLILLHDISERKEFEQALIAEMDRAQVTLHSIGDGVITTDSQGIVDYMNPVAETLTGWSMQSAIGNTLQSVFQVVNETTNKPVSNAVSRCLKANQVITLGKECVLISKSNQEYAIQHSIAPLRGRNGNVLGVVVVFSNVTEARNMAQQIAHQATHDALTGLVNRREFEKRLSNTVLSAREQQTQHCLCYLDLDQFKIVNDTVGHVAGDELLRKITILLKSKIRSRDTLARYGGDEFGLLLDNCPLDQAFKIANSLVAAVRNFQFVWEHRTFRVGVSIGLVPISEKTNNVAEIMSQADVACYTAKDLGRNQVHIYEHDDNNLTNRHSEILKVAELADSVKANRFRLYCQSITPLQQHNCYEPYHYELLIRSVDHEGKIELPKSFIPAAERYGMMNSIDRWVIQTAFSRYKELFAIEEQVKIAINLSGNSLADSSLLQYVREKLIEARITPRNICFEITETAAISNLEQARRFIIELKALGCQFALDDFGSGLSSFTYLKNLPVDYLKIDGSFVQDMTKDPTSEAMVAAINEVGHTMGIKTIAECVQSNAIIDRLTRLGVDYAQGYAVDTPMPIDVVASKISKPRFANA